jgi:hypothetical protein
MKFVRFWSQEPKTPTVAEGRIRALEERIRHYRQRIRTLTRTLREQNVAFIALSQEEKQGVYRERAQHALIDFDGTLSQWSYPELGDPQEGAREALFELRRRGYRLIIWTSRMDRTIYTLPERLATKHLIEGWLLKHDMPWDEIDMGVAGKRLAGIWIDDKVIHHLGDWDETLRHAAAHQAIEEERQGVTGDENVDAGVGSGAEGDGDVPAGPDWGSGGGCNDKS